jgi:phospholipid/cholesterol/gamma-HCH transport system ATP-binding protein
LHLRCQELTVRFEGQTALSELDQEIPAGSWLGVYGGPGSGKTTFLKALAGLLRPNGGRVLWDGDDIGRLGPEEKRQRQARFGMVFQTDALFDSATVMENVLLPLVRRRVPAEEARTRAHRVLEQVGMGTAEDLLPDALSGGMKKRAGIARALVARPEVLLADDPLAGLDPGTASRLCRLLMEVSEGKTLIVAMPDPVSWLPLPLSLHLVEGRAR